MRKQTYIYRKICYLLFFICVNKHLKNVVDNPIFNMSKLNVFGFITKCICDIAVGRTNKVFLYKFMFIVRAFTICVVAMGLVFTSNLCLADDETEIVFEIDAEIEETGNIAYELNSLNYCASEDFIETEEEIAITAETESVPTNIGYNRGSADTRIKDF